MRWFSGFITVGLLLMGGPLYLRAGDDKAGSIAVEVKGTLTNVTFVMGPDDDSPRLAWASVRAAGKELQLDCSKCVLARRELIRRFAHPGGGNAVSYPEVVVKGKLEFRIPDKGDGSKDVSVPFVVVESLSIPTRLNWIP